MFGFKVGCFHQLRVFPFVEFRDRDHEDERLLATSAALRNGDPGQPAPIVRAAIDEIPLEVSGGNIRDQTVSCVSALFLIAGSSSITRSLTVSAPPRQCWQYFRATPLPVPLKPELRHALPRLLNDVIRSPQQRGRDREAERLI